jgi:hypothetical protein
MKQASKRAPGRRKFCWGPDLTNELYLGLRKLFPRAVVPYESIFVGTPADSINDPTKFREEKIQGGVHTKKTRNFGRTCNIGWMKKIVDDANRLLRNGHGRTFTPGERQV